MDCRMEEREGEVWGIWGEEVDGGGGDVGVEVVGVEGDDVGVGMGVGVGGVVGVVGVGGGGE